MYQCRFCYDLCILLDFTGFLGRVNGKRRIGATSAQRFTSIMNENENVMMGKPRKFLSVMMTVLFMVLVVHIYGSRVVGNEYYQTLFPVNCLD